MPSRLAASPDDDHSSTFLKLSGRSGSSVWKGAIRAKIILRREMFATLLKSQLKHRDPERYLSGLEVITAKLNSK